MYVYSTVAVSSAKDNAKRLRQQDGGVLDLRRQSLRQHGLLNERDSVGPHSPPVGGIEVPEPEENTQAKTDKSIAEEAVTKEIARRKERARLAELEEQRRIEKERYSLWNWVKGLGK